MSKYSQSKTVAYFFLYFLPAYLRALRLRACVQDGTGDLSKAEFIELIHEMDEVA
jgi:hypothetical protein